MKRKHHKIPAVEHANGRIVWRPYINKASRTEDIQVDRKGRLAPPILLGKETDDPDSIMRAYLAAKNTLEKTRAAKLHTLRWLMDEYMHSRQYSELAVGTRQRDVSVLLILDHPLEVNGKEDQLGNLHLKDISKPLFNQIKESRYKKRQQAGHKGEAATNREISLVSSALSWGVNNLTGIGIEHNPLLGFKKLKETPNKRYVTDSEYQQQYGIASEDKNSILPIVFEFAYLVAGRGVEIMNIKVSDCSDEGIHIHRTKGSKSNVILWSPRLQDAYQAAFKRHRQHKILPIDPPLLLTRDGLPLSRSGLNSAMQRLKQKMAARGLGAAYWNLHLLKAKGVSDANNKRIAGHRSEAMRERYNTKIEVFEPAG